MRTRSAQAQEGARAPLSTSPRTAAHRDEPVLRLADDEAIPSGMLERISTLLKPGRTLRIPVGYLFLAVAVAIVLLWLTYMVGNSRGYSAARADLEDKFRSQQRQAGVHDPLTLAPGDQSKMGGSMAAGSAQPRESAAAPPSASALVTRPPSQWGPIAPKTDPRKKGWNYFVIAETSPQGAERVVEFCRSNGLETYVIPSAKSQSRRRVAAFPGFQESQLAPAPSALRQQILEIGIRFKQQNKNAGTDFSDLYYDPFD